MSSATVRLPDAYQAKSLTDMLQTKLQNPATSPEFDFHSAVDQLLADVGLTARDSGGKLTFYGQDPIVPSTFKLGAMAGVGLAGRSIALAALWKSQTGEALRRRSIEGGSYRVVVSLTRTVLWLLSMGICDKAYAQETAGSTDEHTYVAPDLFIAETPLGTYQGMTDQVVLSRTPGAFRTVLVPRGSSKPHS